MPVLCEFAHLQQRACKAIALHRRHDDESRLPHLFRAEHGQQVLPRGGRRDGQTVRLRGGDGAPIGLQAKGVEEERIFLTLHAAGAVMARYV